MPLEMISTPPKIEAAIRKLLEKQRDRHNEWVAATIKLHGHMVNPLSTRPMSVKRLSQPYPSGASDRKLDAFEKRAGFRLPRSLRQWLKITNGAAGFLGIRPKKRDDDLEREMDFWRDWRERGWIPVARDVFGNRYMQHVPRGASDVEPVCYVEMIGDYISYVAASNMMQFALMYLEDEFQIHERKIKRAGVVKFYPKRRFKKGAPRVPVDWQFNKRYMLLRDPDLNIVKHLPLPWTTGK
jgi:hypothetical protein